MYNARNVVGDFFEELVKNLFDLIRTDRRSLHCIPDLISKDASFFVEVKASAYDNGGVINKGQLYGLGEEINIKRFYAFAYHPITENMRQNYPTEEKLKQALSLKSLYIFPFSIVKAHFEHSKLNIPQNHDAFVQLNEKQAKKIFDGNIKMWKQLNIDIHNYKMIKPEGCNIINIITRSGHLDLEQKILESFQGSKHQIYIP